MGKKTPLEATGKLLEDQSLKKFAEVTLPHMKLMDQALIRLNHTIETLSWEHFKIDENAAQDPHTMIYKMFHKIGAFMNLAFTMPATVPNTESTATLEQWLSPNNYKPGLADNLELTLFQKATARLFDLQVQLTKFQVSKDVMDSNIEHSYVMMTSWAKGASANVTKAIKEYPEVAHKLLKDYDSVLAPYEAQYRKAVNLLPQVRLLTRMSNMSAMVDAIAGDFYEPKQLEEDIAQLHKLESRPEIARDEKLMYIAVSLLPALEKQHKLIKTLDGFINSTMFDWLLFSAPDKMDKKIPPQVPDGLGQFEIDADATLSAILGALEDMNMSVPTLEKGVKAFKRSLLLEYTLAHGKPSATSWNPQWRSVNRTMYNLMKQLSFEGDSQKNWTADLHQWVDEVEKLYSTSKLDIPALDVALKKLTSTAETLYTDRLQEAKDYDKKFKAHFDKMRSTQEVVEVLQHKDMMKSELERSMKAILQPMKGVKKVKETIADLNKFWHALRPEAAKQ